jgi:crotonobetainyl-CoA:carnitine CoA-transferase CaiB-like acyl-CoA transferase
VIGIEFDLSESLARLNPIPSLGQDTGSILEELGYTPDEIQKLKSEGVVEGV